MKKSVMLFVGLILLVSAAAGEIIIRHDDNKEMIIGGDEYQVEGETEYSGVSSYRSVRGRMGDVILAASKRNSIDPRLIESLIQVESQFKPYAISRAGAMGLMQLMPDTADHLGVSNPFDIEQNVNGGVRYLRRLLDRFGNIELALAAYNAGPAAVEIYNGIPPYPETMRYVKKIMALFQQAGGISPFAGKMKITKDEKGLSITNNIYHKER